MPGVWTCQVDGEDATQVSFEGPNGRLHADVHRGRINREVYRGLLSMRFPKQRLTLTDPFKVEMRRSEPRHLRIYQTNGRGGDIVLRLVDGPFWPKFLAAEIREIFELKVEPGTTQAALRASGAAAGMKGAGRPKPNPKGWSPERRAKQMQTLREKGMVPKEDKPKRRKKKRGRKSKVASGRKRIDQGLQHLPEAAVGNPEGHGPESGNHAGLQEAELLSRSIITA